MRHPPLRQSISGSSRAFARPAMLLDLGNSSRAEDKRTRVVRWRQARDSADASAFPHKARWKPRRAFRPNRLPFAGSSARPITVSSGATIAKVAVSPLTPTAPSSPTISGPESAARVGDNSSSGTPASSPNTPRWNPGRGKPGLGRVLSTDASSQCALHDARYDVHSPSAHQLRRARGGRGAADDLRGYQEEAASLEAGGASLPGLWRQRSS
jgi:hypothetical protein